MDRPALGRSTPFLVARSAMGDVALRIRFLPGPTVII
jgi:hypothetical protein